MKEMNRAPKHGEAKGWRKAQKKMKVRKALFEAAEAAAIKEMQNRHQGQKEAP